MRLRELLGAAARVDPRHVQDLAGIQVPNSRHQLLIEQCDLNRSCRLHGENFATSTQFPLEKTSQRLDKMVHIYEIAVESPAGIRLPTLPNRKFP